MTNDIVKDIGEKFIYRSDPKFFLDPWFVMPLEDGNYYGDCDDFAVTTLYKILGFWGFIWNVLILKKYKFIGCYTTTNEYHVYIEYNDTCWDNWSRKVMPKDKFLIYTRHKYDKIYKSYHIFPRLLSGLILNIKRKYFS